MANRRSGLEAGGPDELPRRRQLGRGHKLYRAFARLGEDTPEALEILVGAARPILDRWFESDALKATLATDAIIGTFQPISAPGTGYVLREEDR